MKRVCVVLAIATCAVACGTPAHRGPSAAPGAAPPGMVWVPGGEFQMGDDGQYASPTERPVHTVIVDGFFMDAHTVTNAEFAAFVTATKYVTVAEHAPTLAEIMRQVPPGTPPPDPRTLVAGSVVFAHTTHAVDLRDPSQWWRWTPGADWHHPGGPETSIADKSDYPVVQIAWNDAVAYADWSGKRLPTEAEWEFAARANTAHAAHPWGEAPIDISHPQAHIYEGQFPMHAAGPKPVGSFAPNAFGLYDMSGNVWQWTLDWFRPDAYQADKARGLVVNPRGPESGGDPRHGQESAKVTRGGSFLCSDSYCRGYRVSARSPGAPDTGTSHIGFRTIMTVDQWKAYHAKGRTQ